jgi:hypothetical protein
VLARASASLPRPAVFLYHVWLLKNPLLARQHIGFNDPILRNSPHHLDKTFDAAYHNLCSLHWRTCVSFPSCIWILGILQRLHTLDALIPVDHTDHPVYGSSEANATYSERLSENKSYPPACIPFTSYPAHSLENSKNIESQDPGQATEDIPSHLISVIELGHIRSNLIKIFVRLSRATGPFVQGSLDRSILFYPISPVVPVRPRCISRHILKSLQKPLETVKRAPSSARANPKFNQIHSKALMRN